MQIVKTVIVHQNVSENVEHVALLLYTNEM